MTRNVILGAGVAGLGAAYAARQRGLETVVYEAAARAGGLLDNFTVEGFRFDTGVHLSFATEPEVRAVFDRTPYHEHAAESLCWDDGFWLRHPVQNNLYALPAADKVALIAGLAETPQGEIANYRDWLVHQYGLPIAARWPLVYTEKYWTLPAEQLGTDWIGKRMRRADMREVLRGAFSADTPSTYYIDKMRYPKQGGYRAFIEPLIAEANISYGHAVTHIDAAARTVGFANGATAAYDALVSTLPLPQLVAMMDNAPDDIREAASSLFATSMDLISVGFRRPDVPPSLWFYIYDRAIAAARAYAPSIKAPSNVPEGCSSLQFEIYSSHHKPQTLSPEQLKRNIVDGLKSMKLDESEDILFVHHKHVPLANVVFDLGMETRRDRVRDWVEAQGIALAGRFGLWDYLWSNQAMMSGLRAAERFPPAQ